MAENVIYSVLKNNAGVAALVGTRIYPNEAEPRSTLPLVIYERTDTEPWQAADGYTGVCEAEYSFDCWATTQTAATALRAAVRIALDHLTPTTVSGQTITQSIYNGGDERTERRDEGATEPLYVASVDFKFFVTEATS